MNQFYKPLTRLIREKMGEGTNSSIEIFKGDFATEPTDNQTIIKENHEPTFTNKFENFDTMD